MRLLLVEDHPIFRLGMQELVRKRWPEATFIEAETVEAARLALAAERVDLVILDLTLADATGLESATRVLASTHGTPVLVVTASSENALAARLLRLGVSGFVPKEQASGVLSHAIARVMAGGRYVTPDLAERLVDHLAAKSATALPHETLSPQEYRVMLMIAEGKGPSAIAEAMSLSVKTIGTYRARILSKAEWKNNTELTKYCIQHDLTALE